MSFENLPPSGKPVSIDELKDICANYKLFNELQILTNDPPKTLFICNGCTKWPDEVDGISIYPACFFHDLRYYLGYKGDSVSRLRADIELMQDVLNLTHNVIMAELMFTGVRRLGGAYYGRERTH